MPRDATNMPFPRSAPYRASPSHQGDAGDGLDTTLNIENILLEEFNYASLTAYQAMEDRARMLNLYLLLVGALVSGMGAVYQFGGSMRTYSQPLAMVLLTIAGLGGRGLLREAHSPAPGVAGERDLHE
jgi:hypothetical protein